MVEKKESESERKRERKKKRKRWEEGRPTFQKKTYQMCIKSALSSCN